jgi:phosphatidylserine decarboxylase
MKDHAHENVTDPGRARLPAGFAHHLPRSNEALAAFHREIKERVAGAAKGGTTHLASPAVRALAALIDADSIVRMYVDETLAQVNTLPGAPPSTIQTIDELLTALDQITKTAPLYNANPAQRHAFPMSSLFAYMMMTIAGESLFRVASFNDMIAKILREWCQYLDGADSAKVLNETPSGWLCEASVKELTLDDYVLDRKKPHWGFKSYNDFFHREIKKEARPVSDPHDQKVIVSANDGNLVSIARNVKRLDRFWIKGEPFSLDDMLNRSKYVDRFVGGDVFQTFLNGGNYHRWHSPIQGTVRSATIVNGLLFSDAETAGWDPNGVLSEGYYACVNTRALVFVESDDPMIGMVCVIPTGITEISSMTITVKEGQRIEKGQELGYFSYGGSSMCLVFQPGAIHEYTAGDPPPKPIVDPSKGPAVLVNARIAVAR